MFKKAKPLKQPDNKEHGFNYALFLLNLKLRTEGEMRRKMTQRGYAPTVIDEVLAQLLQERLIDDDRYAELLIENMKSYKQYGFYQMKKRLMEKLLPQVMINSKLEELLTVEDEHVIARRYLQKELGPLFGSSELSYEEKQKLMRRLLTRGFRIDAVQGLL